MNKVVMILGPPASGKSTKSNEYIKQDFVYLNRDKLGGKILDLVPKLEAALKASSNVLLDNLFPTKAIRKQKVPITLNQEIAFLAVFSATALFRWMASRLTDMISLIWLRICVTVSGWLGWSLYRSKHTRSFRVISAPPTSEILLSCLIRLRSKSAFASGE